MRPLALVAAGITLVALDFRTESLDLLPDPLGWALVAVGAGWLGLTAAQRLAWVTAALSLSDLALPFRYVRIDPLSGEPVTGPLAAGRAASLRLEFPAVVGWRLAGMSAAMALTAVTLWLVLGRMARRAAYEGDAGAARRLRLAGGLVIGAWVAPYLATVALAVAHGDGSYDAVWNDGLNYLGLAGLAAAAYAVHVLATARHAAWAQRERGWYPSPWDQLRLQRAARPPHG